MLVGGSPWRGRRGESGDESGGGGGGGELLALWTLEKALSRLKSVGTISLLTPRAWRSP